MLGKQFCEVRGLFRPDHRAAHFSRGRVRVHCVTVKQIGLKRRTYEQKQPL